ncbi:hypothetical protein PRIPAC_90839 [Pristionchus pacificus]|uniref:Uncharacterized protein n=1 Tax=Pristionchus pacificus TaxID=54126 RepID=A0A2A6B829_PRIPA|nr:hypothetical protein PRIPAC_90839 [Pristionchus pacificus]|eukprot:PDM62017.1 hypothetical protein PRIPAC_51459 [Pristionchus pacificus]
MFKPISISELFSGSKPEENFTRIHVDELFAQTPDDQSNGNLNENHNFSPTDSVQSLIEYNNDEEFDEDFTASMNDYLSITKASPGTPVFTHKPILKNKEMESQQENKKKVRFAVEMDVDCSTFRFTTNVINADAYLAKCRCDKHGKINGKRKEEKIMERNNLRMKLDVLQSSTLHSHLSLQHSQKALTTLWQAFYRYPDHITIASPIVRLLKDLSTILTSFPSPVMSSYTRISSTWSYDIFDDLIDLDEVHLQMSLVFSQLQKNHLPQLAKTTRSPLPACLSPPPRDRSETFVVHQARSLQIKLKYFTAVCNAIEKNDSYYWKKKDIRDMVEREVARLRSFVQIVQRIIESAQSLATHPGKILRNVSPPGFFLPEEETESRCCTPNADQLPWDDEEEVESPSVLAEYIGSGCPTPLEALEAKHKEESPNEITRCPIESESYLSWEDQEPELPVDTDESTEETYCDEEDGNICSSVRGNTSSLPSVASGTPSSSSSSSSHLSTWELDVGWPQFSTSSLHEKEKKEPWREYVEWQTNKKISLEAFDKYADMAENCVAFDYQSTVVNPAVLLNELNRRKTYRVIESEQSRKSVAILDLGESIMCMNLGFESALPDFSRDASTGRE